MRKHRTVNMVMDKAVSASLTSLLPMYLMLSLIGFSRCSNKDVPCKLVTVIEPSDPVNHNLVPFFVERPRCRGGIEQRPYYQCQPSETTSKIETFYNMKKHEVEQRTVLVPTKCKEVCVCGSCKYRKQGICSTGYRWNEARCTCECIDLSVRGQLQGNGKKCGGVSMRYHIITILIVSLVFMVVIVIILVYYKKKQFRRKYRHLSKGPERKSFKNSYTMYKTYVNEACEIDGKGRRPNQNAVKYENGKTDLDVDQTDSGEKQIPDTLKAQDCLHIGYLAFKKDKYSVMLRWLQEAEKRSATAEESFDYEQLYTYLSLAYFVTGHIENARKYKALAMSRTKNENGGASIVTEIRQDAIPEASEQAELAE